MLLYSGQERPTEQLLMIQIHRMNKIRYICFFLHLRNKWRYSWLPLDAYWFLFFSSVRNYRRPIGISTTINVSLWRRNFCLVFSKSSSLLNKMISHDMLDTVGFQSESVSNFLRCLLNSYSRYKVAPTDCKMPVWK